MADEIVASLREELESAFDATPEVAEPAPPPAETPAAPAEETPTETEGAGEAEAERVRKRDESGRFAKEEADKKAAAEAKKPASPPVPVGEKPASEKPAAPSPQVAKAPQSWKPDAREEWAKLPPRVQQEVIRREGEVQRALQESSEARQGYQKYREAVSPFEAMIRSEGGEPLAAIQGLLQTAHLLRTAPPQVKAAGIARMVQSFLPGREGLELLDAALSGQGQPGYQQPNPAQFRDPRVDEILAERERAHAAEAQQKAEAAAKQVAEIQNEEFFEDVRQDMADLIEVAQRRGVALSVKDAYNRAVNLHPEIVKVLEQRSAAAARNPAGSTARAKAASSSVKASPVVVPKGGGESSNDLRATLDRVAGEIESGGR
jgi:hypothetical protein